jgi:prepilin-type N-terminal cleavage/methylation domain-containing protein
MSRMSGATRAGVLARRAGEDASRGRAGRPGFTLIEAVAAMAVMAVLAAATAGLLLRGATAYTTMAGSAQVLMELSTGLERVDRAIREIPLKSQSGAAPNITSLTGTSLAWSTAAGTWSLTLTGSTLTLTEPGQAAQALLTDVSALSILAFNESNTALAASLSGAACDAIRRVEVSITVTRQGRSETLRTRVFLRGAMAGGSGT